MLEGASSTVSIAELQKKALEKRSSFTLPPDRNGHWEVDGGNLVLKEDEASAQQYALKRDFMMSLRSADVKKVSSSDEMLERLRVDSDLVASPAKHPTGAHLRRRRARRPTRPAAAAKRRRWRRAADAAAAAAGAARCPRKGHQPAVLAARAPAGAPSAPPGMGRRGFAHARGAGGGAQRRRRRRLARPAAREFLRAARFDAPGGISEGIS